MLPLVEKRVFFIMRGQIIPEKISKRRIYLVLMLEKLALLLKCSKYDSAIIILPIIVGFYSCHFCLLEVRHRLSVKQQQTSLVGTDAVQIKIDWPDLSMYCAQYHENGASPRTHRWWRAMRDCRPRLTHRIICLPWKKSCFCCCLNIALL